MLAEIYFLRLEAMARTSEEAIKRRISFRPADGRACAVRGDICVYRKLCPRCRVERAALASCATVLRALLQSVEAPSSAA